MAGTCALRLLGDFEVEVDGRRVPDEAWRHRRGADVVKLLALQPGHKVHREWLMEALWPDLEAEAAAANLRKAVHFARRALGGAESIDTTGDLVSLWPDGGLAVDLEEFEAAAKAALTSGTQVEAAAGLYRGELLPADRYADWTEPRREQSRFLCLELWRSAQRWDAVLDIDRTDESAHRALMQRHLAAGNRSAAVRQFQRLRDVLRVDLGLGPDEETVALFEQALAQDAPEPASLAGQAQAQLAKALFAWNRRDMAEAGRIALEVRDLAQDNRLAKELGEASALLGMVAFAGGRWTEQFRSDFEGALKLSSAESAFVFDAHICLAETMLDGADSTTVAAVARELLPAARQAGSLQGEALASLLLGEADLLTGSTDEADAWLRAAADLFEGTQSVSGQVLVRIYLAQIARLRGDRAGAAGILAGIRPLAERASLSPHLTVRVFGGLIATGADDDERLRAVDEAERTLRPGEVCGPCSISMRINGTIACARAGELAHARRCLEAAEALAGMWQGGPWRAMAWEARAAVRQAEGDAGQAAALLREAASIFGEYGRALDRARCETAAGELGTGNGRGTAAS